MLWSWERMSWDEVRDEVSSVLLPYALTETTSASISLWPPSTYFVPALFDGCFCLSISSFYFPFLLPERMQYYNDSTNYIIYSLDSDFQMARDHLTFPGHAENKGSWSKLNLVKSPAGLERKCSADFYTSIN